MYSRPRLSRSRAPRPSTKTSGSYSGAHHSRIFANGCQTKRLSQSINSSVFHSVTSALRLYYFVNRGNIFDRRASPSIFSGNDLLQAQQILERRRIVIGPFSFTGNFGLKPPRPAEFRSADFALFPMSIFLRPYVLTRHRGKTLH